MRRMAAALLIAAAAGCTDASGPDPQPETEFITRQRAWRPGERDSFVTRVVRTRQFDFLGLALSDDADAILPLDSVWEIVPNPAWAGPVAPVASHFAPRYGMSGVRVPGTGWTTFGLDIHVQNTVEGTTIDWLGAMWANNADSTWKGMILAATAASSLPATFVNTTVFDAANGTAGVGSGEAKVTGGATTWIANGTGSPNTFTASWSFGFGGATTVTTGPYLGGTRRTIIMSININNVGLTRVAGTQNPATQTASFSGFIGGVAYSCVFPTPCTTNVPGAARP